MNVELARRVRDRILEQPEQVNMEYWEHGTSLLRKLLHVGDCGSTCCIAGHAIRECGGIVPDGSILPGRVAALLLGINQTEAEILFHLHLPQNCMGNPYEALHLRLCMYRPGSKGYAQVVADAIDLCISRNGGFPVTPAPTEDVCVALDREREESIVAS